MAKRLRAQSLRSQEELMAQMKILHQLAGHPAMTEKLQMVQ